MHLRLLTSARRLLRSPRSITAELGLVALAGLAAALIEQHPGPTRRVQLSLEHPLGARLVQLLGLDRVLTARWFLAVVALAACSLALVVWEQWGRLWRGWRPPAARAFGQAPFRREGLRPSSGRGPSLEVESLGRAGALGSPLFHTGLLLVALAGVGRLLLGAEAACELVERHAIRAGPGAFPVQNLGLLAEPVGLGAAVRLLELVPAFYPGGALLGLTARVELAGGQPAELAVNAPLQAGSVRLYLTQSYGPAALLHLDGAGEARAALLTPGEASGYEWAGPLPGGLELRLRAPGQPGARPPQILDARVLSGPVLVAAGRLGPGSRLDLPSGGSVALGEVSWWVKVMASRDPTAWPIFAGFGLAILGAGLMVTVTRVDVLVQVEPAGAQERVVLAMRPQRLAPLQAERFERLVRRELGPGEGD